MKKTTSYFNKVLHYLQSFFLSGLFTLLPIIVTIGLFSFTLKLLKSWFEPITRFVPDYLKIIPYSEIILVILFIFIFGFILRVLLLQPLILAIEGIFGKIPLVRQVYFGIKQLVHALSSQDKNSFQCVVLIQFPREGMYSLGFLTSENPSYLLPGNNQRFLNIFIPTTPNPTTGFYIIIDETECIITDLTRQEAMAIIISGGIIQPDRFIKK